MVAALLARTHTRTHLFQLRRPDGPLLSSVVDCEANMAPSNRSHQGPRLDRRAGLTCTVGIVPDELDWASGCARQQPAQACHVASRPQSLPVLQIKRGLLTRREVHKGPLAGGPVKKDERVVIAGLAQGDLWRKGSEAWGLVGKAQLPSWAPFHAALPLHMPLCARLCFPCVILETSLRCGNGQKTDNHTHMQRARQTCAHMFLGLDYPSTTHLLGSPRVPAPKHSAASQMTRRPAPSRQCGPASAGRGAV